MMSRLRAFFSTALDALQMPHLEFTSQLAQHVDCPSHQTVTATSLKEALESMFSQFPALRDYVMQADGSLQPHVSIFIDGHMLPHGESLDLAVDDESQIFVMQALAGG